jgi:glycosyltransferase involved in cell wall biosynthesis
MWPDIKKEIPDAELHVFYGWKLFHQFYHDNPERMEWMNKMNKLMEQSGITHHGRVCQTEMEEWCKKCGIWAYSTSFYEINCISAIKAQAWGAVPVVINFAALKETVQFGKKVDGDIWDKETREEYKQALIEALKNDKWQEEQRTKMIPWAKGKYGWDKIAQQWDNEFKYNELKDAMDTVLKSCSSADKFMPVQMQKKYKLKETY